MSELDTNISATALKALNVLDFVGELRRPVTVAEVAAGIGADRATAYRMLMTLVQSGYVQKAADAKHWALRAATDEGMLIGISSGATLAAIDQKLAELPPGSRVLGFNYDTGERYLSVPDFLPEI